LQKVEVAPDVYWVGAVDWDVRRFHGAHHSTFEGTTYNAYLVMDEKVALIDTVHARFADEMMARISELVDPSKIDYVVANHGEPDHSGCISRVIESAKNGTVVCTKNGEKSLRGIFHGDWRVRTVGTGDSLSLGRNTLSFIEAPMLHWPDSMFTYVPELELLMPNDAFGQHLASSGRFDDEVDECSLMREARKYYANILTPFSALVTKKIAEVEKQGIRIKTIAPSHGVVWRTNPGKIIEAYKRWATVEAIPRSVVVAYESMWGGTEAMARRIVEAIASQGIQTKLFMLSRTDRSDVISEILEAKAVVIGSPTLNNGVLPQVAELLSELKGLRFRGRIGAAFGCYGWGGGATKVIKEALTQSGITVALPELQCNWHPDEEVLNQCFQFGLELARVL